MIDNDTYQLNRLLADAQSVVDWDWGLDLDPDEVQARLRAFIYRSDYSQSFNDILKDFIKNELGHDLADYDIEDDE